jgi:acyl carrier protein phosphodiesterase
MYANLFGDFVKGNQYHHFSNKIIQGIELHREIDNYFDQHSAITEAKRALYPFLPKVSAIAMDLYIDHLLAKNWSDYHNTNFAEFLESFYMHTSYYETEFSNEYVNLILGIKKYRWLDHYPYEYGLDKACQGLSNRISFNNNLWDGLEYFKKHRVLVEQSFREFMLDANKIFNVLC